MPEASFIGDVTLGKFILFIFVIIITIFAGSSASRLIIKLLREKTNRWIYKTLSKVVMYGIYFYGFYFGFNRIINFNFEAFAAAFGILSLAIAFSSQQIIQNLIAGIIISLDRPFKEGDIIETQGTLCKVSDIRLRKTVLRAFDGRIFYVPNAQFITGSVINYTKGEFIRVPVNFSVNTESDLEKVRSIVNSVCFKSEDILPNVPKKELNVLQKLFHLPKNLKSLEPRIFYKSTDKERVSIEVWFWIWDIAKKEQIVSDFFDRLRKEFVKNGIKFG